MRLENRTVYATKDLRALVQLVAAEELNPGQLKHLTIRFVHKGAKGARDDRYKRLALPLAGPLPSSAGLRYNRFNVSIRKPAKTEEGPWTPYWAATMLAHEMAECRGKRHATMHGSTRYGYGLRDGHGHVKLGANLYWRDQLDKAGVKLHREAPKPKPERVPVDIAAARKARLQHAESMLKRWESRLRLAQTKVKSWQRKSRARARGLVRVFG